MTTKKRKLNRGLDALLGTELTKQKGGESAPLSSSAPADGELRQIRLERLQRGKYQPRVEFDDTALNELAESIKAQGVMQPIVVRAISSDRFEIVAGERRWRASGIVKEVAMSLRSAPDREPLAAAAGAVPAGERDYAP